MSNNSVEVSDSEDDTTSPLTPNGNNDATRFDSDEEDYEDSLLDVELLQSGIDMRMPRRRNKYKQAMKSMLPVRFEKGAKDEIPEATAGFFSLLTYSWLTPIMWRIYKKGIGFLQTMRCPDRDRAQLNVERLERLWNEELKKKGPEKASFGWVVFRFCRTRIILGGLTFVMSVTFSFTGPAFIMNHILQTLIKGDVKLGYGVGIVVALTLNEVMKSLTFNLGWMINQNSGIRVRSATLGLLYKKILVLRGLQDKTVGEIVNLFSNDGQRLFDALALGPLLFGGPVVLLYGIVYTVFLIGPWALVGSATFLAFYPFMAFISKMTAYYRRKGIAITDKRVRMMSELLNYVKLIKMYAWEGSFARKIAGIRADERSILEKAAIIQGTSTSSAPLVPVMAGVFVIVSHVLMGNDLTAAQAFTLLAIYNAMRFALGVIPHAVKAMAEVLIAFQRIKAFTFVGVLNSLKPVIGQLPGAVRAISNVLVTFERVKSLLLMEEMKPHMFKIQNTKNMVVMKNATLRWDTPDKTDIQPVKVGMEDIQIKVNGKAKAAVSSKENLNEEKQKLKDDIEEHDVSTEIPPALSDIEFVLEKINVIQERVVGDQEMTSQCVIVFVEHAQFAYVIVRKTIYRGKTIGVCGSVGCGKSSLISSILGRMILLSGKVAVNGSIGYVSQQAWIENATVRENILFGQAYDEERYNEIVKACALEEDLKDFTCGDLIEIGERGLNLSGGQKQRISLARAVYANKDIYLLDDPLSAVDIHVGRHIFTECLMKCLKGKSILFVTHQLQYLSQCDSILVMKDGQILESGQHADLMALDGEYASLISTFYTQDNSASDGVSSPPMSPVTEPLLSEIRQRTLSNSSKSGMKNGAGPVDRQISVMSAKSETSEKPSAGKLIVAEERAKGKVTARVYLDYMKAGGGVIVSNSVLLIFVISIAVQTGTSWWLSYWLNQGGGGTNITVIQGNMTVNITSRNIRDNPDLKFYALIYGMGVVVIVLFTILRIFSFMKTTLRASSSLHDNIFRKVLSCPMEFFDTTPVGRIINRFSSDMDEIDVRLPSVAELFLMNIMTIIFALVSICYVSPWFLLALVPLVIGFIVLNVIFTSGVRELKRLDATTKSPLISHVTASVQGISTIHAYGKNNDFESRFYDLMDTNTVPFFLFYSSNRWLAVRLDMLSWIVIAITGLLVLLTYESMTPALAGMAMAFAIQMTGLFQFTIRLAIETEARFVSIERLRHYSKDVKSEAPPVIKDKRPPADWPQEGCISFKQYKMKYRKDLPLALKGVSFDILPKEKIGIVGRSGSGKSSLGVALFRLVEADSGSIEIDKIHISTIGLEDLRSKLSIIPQDPVLFVGTVRYNLDPFGKYKDEEIWSALEKCHIKDTIKSLEQQLDSPVIENGENFSVGERQLMCLARALLRHSRIIMLDEATAAIDTETDALVQTTIKEAFHDCTMLIIAHRLNTVLNCSRILVMQDGKVAEMGKPSSLMSNPKSKFKMMMDASESQEQELLS